MIINKKEEIVEIEVPYSFNNAKELMDLCKKHSLKISQLVMENDKAIRSETEVKKNLK